MWVIKNVTYLCIEQLGIADPNQLITRELLISGKEVHQLENQIIAFKYMKNERNLIYSTIHSRLATVYHFYTINRVRLNKDFIAKFKPSAKRRRQDKAYSIDQIRRMYDTPNERDKVILVLMASVGLRIGALPSITIGDLTKVHPPGYLPADSYIYKINIYPKESEEITRSGHLKLQMLSIVTLNIDNKTVKC